MDEYAVGMSVDLLSRHSLRNNLYLAAHEFRDLSRPFEWGLLARLGSRLHVMACPNDTWLSRRQFDDMHERLPGLQATWHDDLTHAFCVSHYQSERVASVVAGIAREALHQGGLPAGTGGKAQAPEANGVVEAAIDVGAACNDVAQQRGLSQSPQRQQRRSQRVAAQQV